MHHSPDPHVTYQPSASGAARVREWPSAAPTPPPPPYISISGGACTVPGACPGTSQWEVFDLPPQAPPLPCTIPLQTTKLTFEYTGKLIYK